VRGRHDPLIMIGDGTSSWTDYRPMPQHGTAVADNGAGACGYGGRAERVAMLIQIQTHGSAGTDVLRR
jgi:hypothetical protein